MTQIADDLRVPGTVPAKVNEHVLFGDGNAFAILGQAARAMRLAGWNKEQRNQYFELAKAGNYDHLIAVTLANVEVTDEDEW